MKSAIFYGKHDLRLEDSNTPQAGPQEVLIRVMACGVCGTDVHIYEGDQGAAGVTPPTILGHEFSGIIEAVGSDVTRFQKGDRVCIDPNHYCGECYFCQNGIAHYCENMTGYGTTVNGGFAEFCAVDQKQVYRLGNETTFAQGAMTEPVACCLHGIDLCEIQPGSTVVVLGGGMIGLIMLQLAQLCGATTVALVEPIQGKREIAKKLGADLCIDPFKEYIKEVLEKNGIQRVNTVIECVGSIKTIQQAIEVAGNQSTVMMFGLTKPGDELPIKPFEIFQKEIVLKASFINPYTQQRALNLINSHKINVDIMVKEICGLDKLKSALSDPNLRAGGKLIIDPTL